MNLHNSRLSSLWLQVVALGLFVHTAWGQACGEGSFQAEAVLSGSTWTSRNGATTLYTGQDMLAAMQAAVNSLSANRTSKQRVVVRGSGNMAGNASLVLPSFTILDVCGTINVNSAGSGDNAPVRMRNARDVEIRYLTVTGTPSYSVFIREGSNYHLGRIDIRVTSGFGIRIDNNPSGGGNWGMTNRVRNVIIDSVFVSGTSNHGVETYGVDGLTIGSVVARNTGYAGLLLNATINANIGLVDAEGAGTGTGYAAFRMANRNGQIDGAYPTNIRVGRIRAVGGGRGIFCVSESGGVEIQRLELSNTGGNSALIENCYNVNLASVSGTVSGGGEFRLAARTEFANNRDITVQNIAFSNVAIRESPCGENVVFRNISRSGGSLNICTNVIVAPISSSVSVSSSSVARSSSSVAISSSSSSLLSSSSQLPSDCAGVSGGSAVADNCGRCVGGNTGRTACVGLIQGENFCTAQGVRETVNSGFLGTGYVNFDNTLGSTVRYALQSTQAQNRIIALRYANGSAIPRPMSLAVNGVERLAQIVFAPTGSWSAWNVLEVTVPFVQGRNELLFTSLVVEGGPNLDLLGLVQANLSEAVCDVPVGIINNKEIAGPIIQWKGNWLAVKGALPHSMVQVYNLQGKEVLSLPAEGGVTALQAGIYLVRFQGLHGQNWVKKFNHGS